MSIKEQIAALLKMARTWQGVGAGRLAEYGITGANDGVIQTVMEHIPTEHSGGNAGTLSGDMEYVSSGVINDVLSSETEAA